MEIQRAPKIKKTKGLLMHILGKFAIAIHVNF